MYTISRFINGISLNPKEYLLDDDGNVRKFETKKKALSIVGVKSVREANDNFVFIEKEVL